MVLYTVKPVKMESLGTRNIPLLNRVPHRPAYFMAFFFVELTKFFSLRLLWTGSIIIDFTLFFVSVNNRFHVNDKNNCNVVLF